MRKIQFSEMKPFFGLLAYSAIALAISFALYEPRPESIGKQLFSAGLFLIFLMLIFSAALELLEIFFPGNPIGKTVKFVLTVVICLYMFGMADYLGGGFWNFLALISVGVLVKQTYFSENE